jgi:glycosyltransferase involved in cell wall biosynthesis
MSAAPNLRFSVVIPVHNEAEDVQELARRAAEVLGDSHEVIFVDDGSTDATWEKLVQIRDPGRVRLIRFRRNFGKAAGLMAGFAASRGEIVFTMDGDLQDDPAEIPRFLEKLDQGYDLVSGWKRRRYDPWHKVAASRVFNFVVRKLTKLDLHDMNCGFKCYRGRLAREVRIYGELHRFIPALAASEGYRVAEIEVQHRPRRHGRSKYGFSRLFKGFFDLFTVLLTTKYRARPAHGFGWAGLACWAVAAILFIGGAALAVYSAEPGAAGILVAIAAMSFAPLALLAGVALFAAGWVAETVVCGEFRADPASQYRIEERLD